MSMLLTFWDSVIVLCFVVHNFMSILVLQAFWWGRESGLLYFVCLPCVSWLLCGSSSRCHRFVCSLWLWYFLIILTYFFKTGQEKESHLSDSQRWGNALVVSKRVQAKTSKDNYLGRQCVIDLTNRWAIKTTKTSVYDQEYNNIMAGQLRTQTKAQPFKVRVQIR